MSGEAYSVLEGPKKSESQVIEEQANMYTITDIDTKKTLSLQEKRDVFEKELERTKNLKYK